MANVTTDATNTPTELDLSEEALYDMPIEELEKLATQSKLEQPEDEDVPEDSEDEEDSETDEDITDTEDVDENTTEETDEDDTDGVVDNDDQPEEESEPETTNSKPETYTISAVGTKVEFTLDELKEFASKGLDYTKKMHAISPWRKQIEAMKEHNISQDDINMLIDIKSGNTDAVLNLVKATGIDPLDVDLDTVKYTPNNYERTDTEIALRDTVSRLAEDKEVYQRTEFVVDSEWDEVSRSKLLASPSMIEGLHNDIKSGVYDKVLPEMVKLKALDGGRHTDLEYYIEAGRRTVNNTQDDAAKQELSNKAKIQEDIKNNSNKRKAAALPRTRSSGKKDVINYMDEISDDDFKEFMKKVERQY